MTNPIAQARSFLFVPASRPERFVRAIESGAGCVILDLEDAVPPAQKADARASLDGKLQEFDADQLARALVRINAVGTDWHEADLSLVARWCVQGLSGVMLPKAESVPAVASVAKALGVRAQIVPLIESLEGLDAVDLLARSPQVVRIAFGHLDFQLDMGMKCTPDEPELACVRTALVAASRRAQLPAPVDGVTVDTVDVARLALDLARSRAFGFGAKLCIHPAQVAEVNKAFSPSPAELDWARRVLEAADASGGQAVSLDGRMVDLPVIRLAQRMVQQAQPS